MKNKFVYITDAAFYESGALKNPMIFKDHKLEKVYPEFYRVSYDLKLSITTPPGPQEKKMLFYNDYRQEYGCSDIRCLDRATENKECKKVFLNGFDQQHFDYIMPLIQEDVEILYLFKCPKIKDFSALTQAKNLKCLLVFWNNSAENLWDMKHNEKLKAISFLAVSKLKQIDVLLDARVGYLTFDSSDNCGNKRKMLFDKELFNKLPHLQHLTLNFTGCVVDY